jgi:hypothetical protein
MCVYVCVCVCVCVRERERERERERDRRAAAATAISAIFDSLASFSSATAVSTWQVSDRLGFGFRPQGLS